MSSHYMKELALWLKLWIYKNDDLRIANKWLYEHTEYFERGYESDFDEKLHHFFAKKITRFNKEYNELTSLIPQKLREEIKRTDIKEYSQCGSN